MRCTGWWRSSGPNDPASAGVIPKSLASAIIVVVTIVWASNFVLQFVVAEYKPDPVLHGVFMSLVGGALALSRKGGGGDKPGKHREGGGE
jgi:hypothetical protein